ncbi:MAG: Uma2 family endonuclease [Planctomycetaceae bacterium]|nr:Uma2 family endonuclease [Planctomycetaceae bacterium]
MSLVQPFAEIEYPESDGFVVKACDAGLRSTFQTWEEGHAPDVLFEVISSSTRGEDERV